jgi:hypothetical protein
MMNKLAKIISFEIILEKLSVISNLVLHCTIEWSPVLKKEGCSTCIVLCDTKRSREFNLSCIAQVDLGW